MDTYRKISLFFFIDALGWEILQRHPILDDQAPYRQKLQSIFGYSSACDPSIISGMLPQQHLHWSSFYYSPGTCPYPWVKWLKWVPSFVTKNHRVRHLVSKGIKKASGMTGYFQVYQFPFAYLPYFDYAEKQRIWDEGGLLKGETIFDHLKEKQIPYYVGDQDSEGEQIENVKRLMETRSIPFAYLLFGKLDAVMHAHGTDHPAVKKCLESYEAQIRDMVSFAQKHYDSVEFSVFSDHGMHNVTGSFDLLREVEKAGLQFGKDYAAVYDATMARFWFLKDGAKEKIYQSLKSVVCGRWVSDEELKKWGVFFPDRMYGDAIFLMQSGTLIVPSFMGYKQIPGMHGYHPDDPETMAMIISNVPQAKKLNRIEEIYSLLHRAMEQAEAL